MARFSCKPLSEAYQIFTEQETPWGACIPNGTEGTPQHIAACLNRFNDIAPNAERIPLRNLDSCIALHTNYDRLVLLGINETIFKPYIPRRPGLEEREARQIEGPVIPFQMIGTNFPNDPIIRLASSPLQRDNQAENAASIRMRMWVWGCVERA
jgi:hypothetical protein